jgi:septal ring-binding cell division protein DamX
LKDRKLPFIIGGAVVIIILLLLKFMPFGDSGSQGPEVISKRVKIELQDTATDISASTDVSTEGNFAQTAAVEPAAPAAQPLTTAAAEKPAPVQAKQEPRAIEAKPAAAVPAPAPAPRQVELAIKAVKKAPIEKAETPKAAQTVKTVKKTVEQPKKTAAKRITAANAWALNIASFPSLSEAQGLAGKLKKGGYNAYVAGFSKDSVKWHRVRVGFFASRDEAARAAKSIQAKFRVDKPWIAKPDASELKAHL